MADVNKVQKFIFIFKVFWLPVKSTAKVGNFPRLFSPTLFFKNIWTPNLECIKKSSPPPPSPALFKKGEIGPRYVGVITFKRYSHAEDIPAIIRDGVAIFSNTAHKLLVMAEVIDNIIKRLGQWQ